MTAAAKSDFLKKEEKMLTAAAESIGSAIGSLSAAATNAVVKVLPKPAARRRIVKRAKSALRKTTRSASKVANRSQRKTARKVRVVRRSASR